VKTISIEFLCASFVYAHGGHNFVHFTEGRKTGGFTMKSTRLCMWCQGVVEKNTWCCEVHREHEDDVRFLAVEVIVERGQSVHMDTALGMVMGSIGVMNAMAAEGIRLGRKATLRQTWGKKRYDAIVAKLRAYAGRSNG
jgi:hypothetical protein